VIGRADKDGKIIILNYEDYDTIMTKELQQFEKMDVSVEGCNTYLEKVRRECNDLIVKFHDMGAVSDELLRHVIGMKCKSSNSYRKVNGALAKFFLLQYTGVRLSLPNFLCVLISRSLYNLKLKYTTTVFKPKRIHNCITHSEVSRNIMAADAGNVPQLRAIITSHTVCSVHVQDDVLRSARRCNNFDLGFI